MVSLLLCLNVENIEFRIKVFGHRRSIRHDEPKAPARRLKQTLFALKLCWKGRNGPTSKFDILMVDGSGLC